MLLGLAAGITATIVAWGVLVLAAIDFGRDARAGASQSWWLLAAATVGAIACMFLAIIFAARLQARLKDGRRSPSPTSEPVDARPPAEEPVVTVIPPTAPEPPAVRHHAPPEGEPSTYRSKHSRAGEPEPDESADSPAAAYRGKRAAR